ncbi:MAG: metallophosphoesterase [Treponema sp.]|nr:metallophosphoesterase [Candidatus Treponema merdequi]
MKKISLIYSFLFFSLAAGLVTGCSYGVHEVFGRPDDVDKRTSSLKILNSSEVPASVYPDTFNILVFADIHFGKDDRTSYEEKLIQWIKDNQGNQYKNPLFCMCLGDIADHGLENEYKLYKAYTDKMKNETGVQLYCSVGNHDLYNSGWSNYIKYVYPYSSFYKFETDAFSFYSIDTASGCAGKVQYENLKKAFSSDPKKKIIFSHFPLYGEGDLYFRLQDLTERNKLIGLFADNNVSAFISGHTHKNLSTDFKAFYDLNYYALCVSGKALLFHINQTLKTVTWEEINL